MIALTLCHCRPSKTPTGCCVYIIGVEVDFHFVRFGCYDRWLEVIVIRWVSIRVAAAVVHQGRPVPIGDSDKVGRASVDTATNVDGKGSELKPQDLSILHTHVFGLVNTMRIVVRMVWCGDHTWGDRHSISSKQLTKFKESHISQSFLNYLQSHSPQQGKVMTSAKLQSHWLSCHRRRCSCAHIVHSSTRQVSQVHSCTPGPQGAESRVGQEWEGSKKIDFF